MNKQLQTVENILSECKMANVNENVQKVGTHSWKPAERYNI